MYLWATGEASHCSFFGVWSENWHLLSFRVFTVAAELFLNMEGDHCTGHCNSGATSFTIRGQGAFMTVASTYRCSGNMVTILFWFVDLNNDVNLFL